jgi:hypothetical protein
MANVIKMLQPCAFMETINIFPKTLRFFTILFNQANDVYVKIYETAQLKSMWTVKIKIAVVRLVKSLVIFILPSCYL